MGDGDFSDMARKTGPEEAGKRVKRAAERKMKEAEQEKKNGAQDPLGSDPGQFPEFREQQKAENEDDGLPDIKSLRQIRADTTTKPPEIITGILHKGLKMVLGGPIKDESPGS